MKKILKMVEEWFALISEAFEKYYIFGPKSKNDYNYIKRSYKKNSY